MPWQGYFQKECAKGNYGPKTVRTPLPKKKPHGLCACTMDTLAFITLTEPGDDIILLIPSQPFTAAVGILDKRYPGLHVVWLHLNSRHFDLCWIIFFGGANSTRHRSHVYAAVLLTCSLDPAVCGDSSLIFKSKLNTVFSEPFLTLTCRPALVETL